MGKMNQFAATLWFAGQGIVEELLAFEKLQYVGALSTCVCVYLINVEVMKYMYCICISIHRHVDMMIFGAQTH